MMRSLLPFQTAGGLWRQLIDQPDLWPETSGSGLITFAMIAGVRHGWLDETTYGSAARRAWLGLVAQVDADASVHEVCDGTNTAAKMVGVDPVVQRAYYRDRPRPVGHLHGITALLLSATACLQ